MKNNKNLSKGKSTGKTRALACIFSAVLAAVSVPGAASAAVTDKCGGIDVAVANVSSELLIRDSASATGEVIGYLPGAAGVIVRSMGEEWTEVQSGSISGYVKTDYLAFGDTADYLKSVYGVPGAVAAWDDVKVFSNFEDTSSVIASINAGQGFEVLGSTQDWVEVQLANGDMGYVPAEDVALTLVLDTAVRTDGYVPQSGSGESRKAVQGAAYEAACGDAYEDCGDGTGEYIDYGDGTDDYTDYGDGTDEYIDYGDSTDDYMDYDYSSDDYTDYSDGSDDYVDYGDGSDDYTDYSDGSGDYTDYSDGSDDYTDYGDGSDGYTDYGDGSDDYTDYGDGSDNYTDYGGSDDFAGSYDTETSDEPVISDEIYDDYDDTFDDGVTGDEYVDPGTEDNTSGINASADDIDLLAALIYCEAGNQSEEGKIAVGQVVMNRVASPDFADTIRGVIYESGQFTPAYTGWLDQVIGSAPQDCYDAAVAALNGGGTVGDALYFNGGTGKGMQIGDHQFY